MTSQIFYLHFMSLPQFRRSSAAVIAKWAQRSGDGFRRELLLRRAAQIRIARWISPYFAAEKTKATVDILGEDRQKLVDHAGVIHG